MDTNAVYYLSIHICWITTGNTAQAFQAEEWPAVVEAFIQLMGAENPENLKHHLNVISKIVEMNQLFVYRTMAKQKPSLTVLYGSFRDRRSAQEALRTLPASLKAYRPILRTVQGIRGEIRQHQTSEQRDNANS